MMGDGRKTQAPCGHEGEVVIGQYVKCLEGCDLSDGTVDFEILDLDDVTKSLCPHCGSDDLEAWPGLFANGDTLMYCKKCGRSSPA